MTSNIEYNVRLDCDGSLIEAFNIKERILSAKSYINSEFMTEILSKELAPALHCLSNQNDNNLFSYVNHYIGRSSEILDSTVDNIWYAKVLNIGSIRFVNSKNVEVKDLSELNSLIINMTQLCCGKIPATTSILKTILFLICQYGEHIECGTLYIVLQHISTLFVSHIITISRTSKDIFVKMIKHFDEEIKGHIMKDIAQRKPWSKCNYILLIGITKSLDYENLTYGTIQLLLEDIYMGMQSNQMAYDAGYLFEIIMNNYSNIGFEDIILPTIIEWSRKDDQISLTSNIKCFIINTCVKVLHKQFYNYIKDTNVTKSIKVHTLYMCIKNGFIHFNDCLTDIESYLKECNLDVRKTAFQCICEYTKSTDVISTTRLNLIYKCLNAGLINTSHLKVQRSFLLFFQNFCNFICILVRNYKYDTKLFKMLPTYCAFYKDLINLCLIQLNLYTEESLSVAKILFEALSLGFEIYDKGDIGNTCQYQEFKDLFKDLYENYLIESTKIIFKHIQEDDNFHEDGFTIIRQYLMTCITPKELIILQWIFMNSMKIPTNTSILKSKHIMKILLRKHETDKTMNIYIIIDKVIEFITNDLRLINQRNNPFKNQTIFNALVAWNVILREFKFDIKHKAIAIYNLVDELVKRLLIEIEEDFPTGNTKKVMEQIILNCMEVMYATLTVGYCGNDKLESFMDTAESLISRSNMKNPISKTKKFYQDLLKLLAQNMENYDQFIEQRMHRALTLNVTNQKIRKHPEATLIIHSLALSDKTSKRYVDTCIQYLLRFLTENSNLTTLSTLAALFSLEGLMQDKTLTHETLLYEYEVMRLAINMFGAHDYAIKNAAMQLIQTLTTRMLGQPGTTEHIITSQEFFISNMQLTNYMLQVLNYPTEHVDDKILAVLMFLMQIISSKNCVASSNIIKVHECFVKILRNLIDHNVSQISSIACKAYMALIELREIPKAIISITDYMLIELLNIPKNTLSNMLMLINDMKSKYYQMTNDRQCLALMERALFKLLDYMTKTVHRDLIVYLNFSLNTKQLLYEEYKMIVEKENITANEGLQLKNILIFLIEKSDKYEFHLLMKEALTNHNATAQEICLRGVIMRLVQNVQGQQLLNLRGILNCLIKHLLIYGDFPVLPYLMDLFVYTLIMVIKHLPRHTYVEIGLYNFMMIKFNEEKDLNINVEVYIAVLYKVKELTPSHRKFADELLCLAEENILGRSRPRRKLLSHVLIFFEKCINVSSRPKLLSIATTFLLEDNCDYEPVYTYLNLALRIHCSDYLLALNHILNYRRLVIYFNSFNAVQEFYLKWVFKLEIRDIRMKDIPLLFYPKKNNNNRKMAFLGRIYDLLATLRIFPYESYVAALDKTVH